MAENNVETEIKIRIRSVKSLPEKLMKLHAKKISSVKQEDVLWDYTQEGKTFETYDQALRLRIEKDGKKQIAIFTFKGTPTLDEVGVKSRDEYNVEISDPSGFKNILMSIGFFEALKITKKRMVYKLDNIEVCIDELVFGKYVELEGKKEDITKAIKLLDLGSYPVEKRPYYLLQLEWDKFH